MNSRWLLGACLMMAAAAPGQSPESQKVAVRGEIVGFTQLAGHWTVELMGNGATISETADVNSDSTFEFRSVAPGPYQLRLTAPDGKTWYQEYVSVSPYQTLSIHPPDPPSANHTAGNTIGLQQLIHQTPPRAQKAFQNGERAASRHQFEQARECFQEAVALDPDFADAHNELGASEAKLNHLPEAAEQFQKAIDLVPEHRQALPNLSIVLARMNRFREAGEFAARALKVQPASARLHYILAISLLNEPGEADKAILHLEHAADEIPSANLTAAYLLAQQGRSQEAVRHVEAYLQKAAPADPLRPKAQALLAQLRP